MGFLASGTLAHTPRIFHELKLLTIFDVYKLQSGNLVYETINGISPVNKVIKYNFYVSSVRSTP